MKNERILWLDVARGSAIICVVLCHATENIYQLNLEFISQISAQSKIFALLAFTCGRLGVPLFLLISGYLLLDRHYGNEGSCLFWKKNLLGLLTTTEIWIVIYNVFLCWFNNEKFDIASLIKEMLFLKYVNVGHIWYVSMIIGMYIFLPLIADALQEINVKRLKIPLIISCIYLFFIPTNNVLDLSYSGGIYGIYLLSGYLIKKNTLKQISTRKLIAGSII